MPKSPDAEPDLRRAIDTIPQLVWSAFPDGSVEFCNWRWLEYTGLTAEQAQGWGWRTAIHPEDLDELVATWRRVLAEGGPGEAEARMRTADGSFRWFLIRARPLSDDQGRIVRWYGTNTDIDERKRAEERLSLSNDRLSLAMRSGKAVGWEWDLKTGRDSWFGDLKTMFGIPSNTYVGRPEDFHRYVHPEDRKLVSDAVADARINHRPYAAEFRVAWPDGTVRWVTATGKFYYSPSGEPERMLGMAVDITERKQAEDAVRETEKRYRRIVETTNEGVWLLDSKLHTSYVNQQMAEMLGYEPGEMVGQSVFDSYFPEDVEHKKEVFKQRQQGVRAQFEERLRQKDGSELWVRMAAVPIFTENGEFDGALAMVSDITERMQAEEALRESEARLRLAAQVGKMYAYEWDVVTDKVVRSEEYGNILGFNHQKELAHEQLLASVYPEDRALFVGFVDQLTPENPTTQLSYRVLHPDGSVVWLEKNARAFFDDRGRMLRMIGMVADITERKRTEEALRESEERLRLAVQAGRMYAFEWDAAADAIVRSGQCANILNWMDHPTRDTGRQFVARVHPDDRGAYVAATESGLTPENATYQINYRMLRPDGSVIWLEESGRAFFDGQGRMLRTVGMVADVTERKLAEEALSSVSRTVIQAEERERNRIARDLHEDIGQRLALLAIRIEELKDDLPNPAAQLVDRIDSVWKQTLKVLNDVKASAHELYSPRLEYLGIAAVMRSFCKELGERKRVEIDFRNHGLPSVVPPDVSICLFRVLQEALHNGLKHSGVQKFEVQLWGASDDIHLTISDSGAGFDLETVRKGRGLGLIRIEQRLNLLKGTFSIDSQPKHGCTIHARVPLSSGSASTHAAG